MLNEMNFQQALTLLKEGKSVAREGWNGKGMYITAQFPDEHSKMTSPYIFMTCPIGSTKQFGGDSNEEVKRIPWLCSFTDMFASDWMEVEV